MPGVSRRKNPIVSRRRGKKVDEDEELGVEEDSFTDDSGISDDDAATEGSLTDDEGDEADEGGPVVVNGAGDQQQQQQAKASGKAVLVVGKALGGSKVHAVNMETEMMLNGMRGTEDAEVVEFTEMKEEEEEDEEDEAGAAETTPQEQAEGEGEAPQDEKAADKPQDKRRGDHEDYKKRRDADPTFVPNRGGFYLHDHRHAEGSNGFRPFRGGARGGRGRYSGDFAPQSTPLEQQWQHDMHEEVHQEVRRPQPAYQNNNSNNNNNNPTFAGNRQRGGGDTPRSFGRTVYKGTVQIQVHLPEMKDPITFSEVPSKVYTRLPYHRPPLRRDKPVRIALPDAPVRYIYPSPTRSFIFIPRAMRPGGSGYIRGGGARGRGNFYSQGRSAYGGSTGYSPSVGMSRRSSLQHEVRPIIQAAGQVPHPHPQQQHLHPQQLQQQQQPPPQSQSQAPNVVVDSSSSRPLEETPTRPVVKLPGGPGTPKMLAAQQQQQQQTPAAPQNAGQTPAQALTPKVVPQHPPPSYTPSVNPIPYREHRATPKIPMHQPRPQKAVNVAEIDSPAVMHYQGYNGVYPENIPTPNLPHNMYAHSRHPSYPSQTSGTPLSHIPEGAVHARSFHPSQYPPQGAYYPYPQQPMMHPMPHQQPMHHDPRTFVPPPPPYVPSGPSPMPNGAPGHYVMHPVQPHQPQPPVPTATPSGPTTIAQESNGMVFYSTVPNVPAWDPNQYYYPQAVTPAPDGPVSGVPTNGAVYYYPPGPPPQQQGVYYAQ